jgi:hypothetical protein
MFQPEQDSMDQGCHAECSEASSPGGEILRFAQDDKLGVEV